MSGSVKTGRLAIGHSLGEPLHPRRRSPEEFMYSVADTDRIGGRWFTPYKQDPPVLIAP